MLDWLKEKWRVYRMCNRANTLGWARLGTAFANGQKWSNVKWAARIRNMNRLYRLSEFRPPFRGAVDSIKGKD